MREVTCVFNVRAAFYQNIRAVLAAPRSSRSRGEVMERRLVGKVGDRCTLLEEEEELVHWHN